MKLLTFAIALFSFNGLNLKELWLPVNKDAAEKKNITQQTYFLSSPTDLSIDSVVSLARQFPERFKTLESVNIGFVTEVYWLVIPFRNVEPDHHFFIEIQNPQLDRVQAFFVTPESISAIGNETGDAFPFETRIYSHRNFVWPISNENVSDFWVVIKADKRGSSLNLPVYLWESNTFRSHNTQTLIFYGLCIGMLLLISLYSVGVWIFLRRVIYGWFFVRIVTSLLWLIVAEGLAFQFLYPSFGEFNSMLRAILIFIPNAASVGFTQHFLKVKKYSPRLNVLFKIILYVQLAFALSIPFLFDYYSRHSLFWLTFAGIIFIASVFLRLAATVVSLRFDRNVALFYLAAYGTTLIIGLFLMLVDMGFVEKPEFNPAFLGVIVEALILSIGLTYLIKQVYDERNELSSRISRHQKEMMQAYVEGVEKERGRIAGELHDDIGSRLGNLRRVIGNITDTQRDYLEKQVETLSSDVRSLSHQLAPPSKLKGLSHLVEDLIIDVQPTSSTKFSLQCYDVPEKLSETIVQQCYRILQEAINNILKHAKAATADIQIFGHETELVITVEDDGQGFDDTTSGKSIGLQQLRARTESIQGIFEISSARGKGTQIMIRIPLHTIA